MACLEIDVIIDWMKYGISRGYLSLSVIEIRYYGRECGGQEQALQSQTFWV